MEKYRLKFTEIGIFLLNYRCLESMKGMYSILSTDNLPGFSQAITAIYPNSEVQKCIIHQIRSSTK